MKTTGAELERGATLTHAIINERLFGLDRHPVLLVETLDDWLAWPIVKERVWLLCFRLLETRSEPNLNLLSRFRRLGIGLVQIARGLVFPSEADLAMFYEPRRISPPRGKTIHPHLGSIDDIERHRSILHYRYDWGLVHKRMHGWNLFDNHGIGAVIAAAAPLITRTPRIKQLADVLTDAIAPTLPEIDRPLLLRTLRNQLARFRIHFAFVRLLLRRWRVKSVVILDADAKTAEIAAAKSLGLLITEVQHGMFSTKEPDYAWSLAHRAMSEKMPVPNRIVVFGPLWSNQLRISGYWCGDEIIEAQNPVLSAYRSRVRDRPERSLAAPLRLLFPSQPYLNDEAIPFLKAILQRQAESGRNDFHLRIKLHPLERKQTASYQDLTALYSEDCSVASDDCEAFDEMLNADCIVGYTSLMLIEALGLGLPVIGLRGGAAREGFCATFEMPELADLIPEVSSIDSFMTLISAWRDPTRFSERKELITQAILRIYTDDGGPAIEDILAHA